MRRWRALLSVVIAAVWLAAGSDCLLELLPGLGFLSCCQHSQAEKCSAHDDGDCEADGCAAIESGFYQLEKPVVAPVAPSLAVLGWLEMASDCVQPDAPEVPIIASVSPPELECIWQFSLRTAAPPRAPSSVS
jgi:hypothetical protein